LPEGNSSLVPIKASVLAMLAALMLVFATSATAETYSLQVATHADRSSPSPLQGSSFGAGSNIYVFVLPTAGATKVAFYLDGSQSAYRTETKPPFDLAGSNDSTGTAKAFLVPAAGSHSVRAKVYHGSSVLETVSSSYTSTEPPPPQPALMAAPSATRSPASPLGGDYQTGSNLYVFADNLGTGASTVEFWIDGNLFHTEHNAPYDLAGSNDSAGTANPYVVPEGNHQVRADVHYTNGAVATTVAAFRGAGAPPPSGCASGFTRTLTDSNVAELQTNQYHLQANEWGSSAPFSITNDGCLDFKIAHSEIDVSTSGAPGAYPSLYRGCHWGYCTTNSGLPLAVGQIARGGAVKSTAKTTSVAPGAWDTAYDVWWDSQPTSPNAGGDLEMMIWLTKQGAVQPAGGVVASNANIGGRAWNIWHGGPTPGGTVSYVLVNPSDSVTDLDLGPLAADAVTRGYMLSSWYLIGVEFGFEPWQNGTGLSVDSFKVCTPAGC
jgi:Glycosyl hydrolase family 12